MHLNSQFSHIHLCYIKSILINISFLILLYLSLFSRIFFNSAKIFKKKSLYNVCFLHHSDEEDFSEGINTFIKSAKQRRKQRESKSLLSMTEDDVGIENRLIGCITFEKKYV